MKILKTSVLFFIIAGVIASAPLYAYSIRWEDSYQAALKKAAAENKPVMAFFYTNSCAWCNKLVSETFQDKSVEEASGNFICVKIDGEKDRDLVYRYMVKGFPAIFFLDPSGRIIWREFGFREAPMLSSRMAEVVSVYREVAAIQPYLKKAFEEVSKGNPNRAIDIVNEALAVYPDDARLHTAAGLIYANMGATDKALQEFDRSISADPNNPHVYIMRSVIYYKYKYLDMALADLDKAISLDKRAYEAYKGRGVIYMEKGEPELALKNFNALILIDPKQSEAYFYRAQAYLMLKNYEKSREDVKELERRGVKVDPEFLEKLKSASGKP